MKRTLTMELREQDGRLISYMEFLMWPGPAGSEYIWNATDRLQIKVRVSAEREES